MKRFFILLTLLLPLFCLNAQQVDYEIVGFADEQGSQISSIVLNASDDFKPRVILKNNGPAVPAATDSVIFLVTNNQTTYITTIRMMGAQLQSLTTGQQTIVDLAQPIWTSEVMDQYHLMACYICFEVKIIGAATDPDSSNNVSCINFTRPLPVSDIPNSEVSLFPNPTSTSFSLSGINPKELQIFDLSGRRLSAFSNLTESSTFDVSALAEGMYIVKIFSDNGILVKKLSIKR